MYLVHILFSSFDQVENLELNRKLEKSAIKTSLQKFPNVFNFTCYRSFLSHFYDFKKETHSGYSMSVFARRAGLGANSRGYLKLIIEGKRNLTPHTIRRFSEAMELGTEESVYFENLVFYNQAKSYKDQEFFFQRLSLASVGKESEKLRLLRNQIAYFSTWYFVAVRELVGLAEFKEDLKWICAKLRKKISEPQAKAALEGLLSLGLIVRGSGGKLIQKNALVSWNHKFYNEGVTRFHLEMIERAKETLVSDPYDMRDASAVTLSCPSKKISELMEKIDSFRDQIVRDFGKDDPKADSVIQVNFQTFFLTPSPEEKNYVPKK